jgi:hypothetical protein
MFGVSKCPKTKIRFETKRVVKIFMKLDILHIYTLLIFCIMTSFNRQKVSTLRRCKASISCRSRIPFVKVNGTSNNIHNRMQIIKVIPFVAVTPRVIITEVKT